MIDSVAEDPVGGYCLACEKQSFGRSLRRQEWQGGEQCLLCERDGFYKLPLINLQWESESTSIESSLTVSLQDRECSVELCDRHLHLLVTSDPTSVQATLETKRSHM